MIKASELMIGDLVNLSPSNTPAQNYVKIHAIDYDREIRKDHVYDIVFLSTGAIQYNYPMSSLKPIPLTEEILKKNGFKDGQYFAELYIQGWHVISDAYNLCMECERGWHMNVPCRYVHELQHAFNLVGIRKDFVV